MVKSISAEELRKTLDEDQNLILVDCREQDEWDAGHIPQARLIPLSQFEQRHKELEDKSSRIILQCRSGKRSMDAALFLEEQGYSDLTNLTGGILDWMQMGFEVKK